MKRTVECKWCGKKTYRRWDKECGWCKETKFQIERDLGVARKILEELEQSIRRSA